MLVQEVLSKVFQSHFQLARSVDLFIFCAECSCEKISWNGHKIRLLIFKIISSSIHQTGMLSFEPSAIWNEGDA